MDVYDSENYYDGGDNIPASGKGPQYNGRGGNISRVHNHTCLDFAVKPPTNLGRRNTTSQQNRNPRHSESIDFSSDDEDDNKSRRQPTKKFPEPVQHNQEQDNNNQIYDEDIYEGN